MTVYRVIVQYETQDGRTSFTGSADVDLDTAITLHCEYEATGHAVWLEKEERDSAQGQ